MSNQNKGLGRGLHHLGVTSILSSIDTSQNDSSTSLMLPIKDIQPGQFQPRQSFDEEPLEELTNSIKQHGVIQPILVRKTDSGYEIIAGERRWQASKKAGLTHIPAVVKSLNDEESAAIGLIENIQRVDLNFIEEAQAISQLIDRFQFTHQQTSTFLGKSRSAISNSLRLLQLNPEVKEMIKEKKLEMGHARAILSIPYPEQPNIAKKVIADNLTVRMTESIVNKWLNSSKGDSAKLAPPMLDSIQNEWSQRLGKSVKVTTLKKGGGNLTIPYQSLGELQSMLNNLESSLKESIEQT
ncbi:MAG TPA: ParB/RepB/Spo0J family partition protein [Gammaproteobacteria bacterium]|nr:ParB/RepB/Spo0J family partition protein [Gammaproteobacteria bacterium]